MIIEGGGLQLQKTWCPKKIQRWTALKSKKKKKNEAVVWQWVATFKEAVPLPPGPWVIFPYNLVSSSGGDSSMCVCVCWGSDVPILMATLGKKN